MPPKRHQCYNNSRIISVTCTNVPRNQYIDYSFSSTSIYGRRIPTVTSLLQHFYRCQTSTYSCNVASRLLHTEYWVLRLSKKLYCNFYIQVSLEINETINEYRAKITTPFYNFYVWSVSESNVYSYKSKTKYNYLWLKTNSGRLFTFWYFSLEFSVESALLNAFSHECHFRSRLYERWIKSLTQD